MGRGEYYKNKYGGGRGRSSGSDSWRGSGRGGGRGGNFQSQSFSGPNQNQAGNYEEAPPPNSQSVSTSAALSNIFRRIDGKQYGAYKDLYGSYQFASSNPSSRFTLTFDRIQADSFAPPSRIHVVMEACSANFPRELSKSKIRKIALCDYLARTFHYNAKMYGADQRAASGGWHGAKGGELLIDAPSQHVLERTCVQMHPNGDIEARFTVALPAQGRTICGEWAATIVTETLPRLVNQSFLYSALDHTRLTNHILSVEDQEFLRLNLSEMGLIGFVANGAILPRATGNSDVPMEASKAIPFQSPPSLQVEVALPNSGAVTGMGIRPGITLIVGGGFHGKSTLLQALEVGPYNHIPGDGREFVAMDPASVKIRAEDGRSAAAVNISPFITNLPFGKDTTSFSTPDASGSTSQAANIVEALEAKSKVLLLDEDTCATNFMIRDARMQMLVAKEKEPITPFICKVKVMHEQMGVSSVLVIGGAGDYFDVADTVVMMDCYVPLDVTNEAKAIAAQHPTHQIAGSTVETVQEYGSISTRVPAQSSFQCEGKIAARGKDKLQYGEIDIDLDAVEQLVETSQTRAIGAALRYLAKQKMGAQRTVQDLLAQLENDVDNFGLDILCKNEFIGDFSRPRSFEVAAALNRFRNASISISSINT